MSFCPTKDIHSVYLDGELPEIYKAEYEQHIQSCEKCRKELMQLKALRSIFKEDSESLKLDSHFLEESYQRLQIKMAYSKNIGKSSNNLPFKAIGYAVSGIAAAAVFALVIPFGLKNGNAKTAELSAISNPISQNIAASPAVPMVVNTSNSSTSLNNVSFDSGRSVVVSGNIQDVVLSSESRRKNASFFAQKAVNEVDVLKPDFQDEAISIKITVPGMADSAVTTEISLPMDVISGRH